MASKLYDFTPTELQKLLDESDSYADLFRKIGMCEYGRNRDTLKRIIEEYNLDLTQININKSKPKPHSSCYKKRLEDILQNKVPYDHMSTLFKRLIKAGYKERKCERCGINSWLGEDLTLHLHHKDGNHKNNELSNLEVLCPNCHSQTDSFAGKNNKNKKMISKQKAKSGITPDGQRLYNGYGYYKILCPVCEINFMKKYSYMCKECKNEEMRKPKVSKEELFKIMEDNTYDSAAVLLGVDEKTVIRWHKYYINEAKKNGINLIGSDKAPSREVLKEKIRTMPFVQIGKEYGVRDNSVRKWCDTYGLPRHKTKIQTYSDEEWEKI